MTSLWSDRTPRERVMLLGLGIVVMLWIAVVGVWRPLLGYRAGLTSQIARFQLAEQKLSNPVQTAPVDARALPVIITETAETFQLTIRRLQPAGDQVQIVLEDSAFETVLVWIETLITDHGLQLRSLDLVRRPVPGVVAATLTVAR
jgi:general secretion pathway protein M